ncbi:hypothetical protein [Hymenobacter sublimis]|uniref:Uncharacterized protein n=1 Tax=Hymenobacter sublimis TaxID=2933777 RepID=A0ABY4J7V1_9BACT|nr:hypothetical protein [Hymenobacter sublimis]UPL48526.1 hypothetical protein MWH26_15200 [Hymenobacter sublimis]
MIRVDPVKNQALVPVSQQEPAYAIDLASLGDVTDWHMFGPWFDIVFPRVSRWVQHLESTRPVTPAMMKELVTVIQKHAPQSAIDWEATNKAVELYREYMALTKPAEEQKPYTAVLEGMDARMKKREAAAQVLIDKYSLDA